MANPESSDRLIITKMVLENFKSYAGVQEIGPFHKRFSSIVGPNGSGKSNVIDALLFVFGKRAKQLRLNKVSELIHKSSGHPNLQYARVSVHFQLIKDDENSQDDFDVVPGSEFVVTRKAFKDNRSDYTVDGGRSSYTDVGLLLRRHGIDLDNNRFLILQGEVEQIAMMKPKAPTPQEEGLLEYLEDIIGSNKYVEKIEQKSKQLDDLNEQRTDKVNRLKIAERERDNLSGSKLEAESYQEKEKEIRRKKNTLYQLEEGSVTFDISLLRQKLDEANKNLAELKASMQESESKFSGIRAVYEETTREHNAVEAELLKANTDFGAFERRDVKLQEDMKHVKGQKKKHEAAVVKEASREDECTKDADAAAQQSSLNSQLTQLNQAEAARRTVAELAGKKQVEETARDEILSGLHEATQELRAKVEAAQEELAVEERGVAGLQTEKETVLTSLQLLRSRFESIQKQINSAQEKAQKLGQDRTQPERRHSEAQAEVTATESRLAALTADIDRLLAEEGVLQASVRGAVVAAEEAKAQLIAQQSIGGRSGVVADVLRAARPGGPLADAGVRGRLGDLATISPEYDIAISTACGMLDYIVVESAEGGQACINYLRERNVGRAAFIVLEQMAQWKQVMERPCNPPAGTPRLFDLITPVSADLRTAFYMAVKDTLVATDLTQAVRIAYVGDRTVWRIVTKDGGLIDNSGSMTGGGTEKRTGGMMLSGPAAANRRPSAGGVGSAAEITQEQVTALEAQVVTLQAQLAECRSNRSICERDRKECQSRIKGLTQEINRLQLTIRHSQEQEQELLARVESLRADSGPSQAETVETGKLQARVDEIEANIQARSPHLGQLRSAVVTLQRRVKDVGGPNLQRTQAKVDLLSKQFDAASGSLSTKEVEEASCRKQAAKAAAAREKAQAEAAKCDERLAALLQEQQEMERDAEQVIEAVELAKARLEDKKAILANITSEHHTLKAEIDKVKRLEVDLGEEIAAATKEVKEKTKFQNGWKVKLEELRRQHLAEQTEYREMVLEIQQSSSAAVAPRPAARTAAVGGGGDGDEPEVEASSMDVDDAAALAAAAVAAELNKTLEAQLPEVEPLSVMSAAQLASYLSDRTFRDGVIREINLMEAERDKQRGNVNMSALREYLRKDMNYKLKLCDLEAITEVRNGVRREYEGLRRLRLEEFMAGFGVITLKLKEMYQMITLGGDAELELVDSLDPFSEGIVFSVRPPKKSWKNISNLSGGEKTLSSLALVFALHHYKPTPLYVMDEIDAALDFKNVSIVANYIKERTKNAQFVIISLRNNMFELADRLVGIYKTHDATKSVTINPKMFESAPAVSSAAAPAAASKVLSASRASQSTSMSTSQISAQESHGGLSGRLGDSEEDEEIAAGAAGGGAVKQTARAVLADATNKGRV